MKQTSRCLPLLLISLWLVPISTRGEEKVLQIREEFELNCLLIRPFSLIFSPDGKQLSAFGEKSGIDQAIQHWGNLPKSSSSVRDLDVRLRSVTSSSKGSWFATTTRQYPFAIDVYDSVEMTTKVKQLPPLAGDCWKLAFSEDESWLACSIQKPSKRLKEGLDGRVVIWNTKTWEMHENPAINARLEGTTARIIFQPGSQTLFVQTGTERTLIAWDCQERKQIGIWDVVGLCEPIGISRSGKHALVHFPFSANVLDLKTNVLHLLPPHGFKNDTLSQDPEKRMTTAILVDRSDCVAVITESGSIDVWSLRTYERVAHGQTRPSDAEGNLECLSLSPDESMLAIGYRAYKEESSLPIKVLSLKELPIRDKSSN